MKFSLKILLEEALWDTAKHVISLAILSCFWAVVSAADSLEDKGGARQCSHTSVLHYHPVRVLVCKLLETKGE